MEGPTEGVCSIGSRGCSGSSAVLATGCSWRWGGPVPPFTFYRSGFRPSCDGDLGKPLHRDCIVINPEGGEFSPFGGRTLSTGPRFEGGFEVVAISGAART
ncbi:hypothetical protein BGK72_00005 [Streptomyces agglomeratus]|nr:hypothetical protein BGK72_00005 [Streptomyces agglomeratus]